MLCHRILIQNRCNNLVEIAEDFFHIVDDKGTLAIDLGVYGAPETFVIDKDGVIQYRHVGAITREVWDRELYPVVELLREKPVGTGNPNTQEHPIDQNSKGNGP